MNTIDRLRLWLLRVLFPKRMWAQSSCANRVTWKGRIGSSAEVTVIVRHLALPDGYSREELVEMQETVWKHEALIGWKVPRG